MPNPTSNSGITDNHERGGVSDFLKAKIHSGSRLSVVSAYFTNYAYKAPKDSLARILPSIETTTDFYRTRFDGRLKEIVGEMQNAFKAAA